MHNMDKHSLKCVSNLEPLNLGPPIIHPLMKGCMEGWMNGLNLLSDWLWRRSLLLQETHTHTLGFQHLHSLCSSAANLCRPAQLSRTWSQLIHDLNDTPASAIKRWVESILCSCDSDRAWTCTRKTCVYFSSRCEIYKTLIILELCTAE